MNKNIERIANINLLISVIFAKYYKSYNNQ